MNLKILDDTKQLDNVEPDGTVAGANGGTEMMNRELISRLEPELLDKFHIIKSRVRHVDPDKKNILWLHDMWNDPEALHLEDKKSRERFDKFVFVSNYQMQMFNEVLDVPYSKSIVLRNAIEPIDVNDKDKDGDTIRIIYHTTPHRGLNIAVAAVKHLVATTDFNIHFDVYSSFEAYGWSERDANYQNVFDEIKNHPNMTYHGYQPNDVVREALKKAHIFAYPSIWRETSCIAAIEAMSAGCQVVCPNYGALPETTGNFALMYQWQESQQDHANIFTNHLYHAISQVDQQYMKEKLNFQKAWTDTFYNWETRAFEWKYMLEGMLDG